MSERSFFFLSLAYNKNISPVVLCISKMLNIKNMFLNIFSDDFIREIIAYFAG